MKIGKIFYLVFLITSVSWGQTKYISSNHLPENKIIWSPPTSLNMQNGLGVKILAFEGAGYDHSDNFLPRFSKRIELNANENEFTATLINTTYEPLSELEIATLDKKAIISSNIIITTKTLSQKKKLYGVLSFIPLRKTATGQYEKLVSFDLQITPDFHSKTNNRSTRIYAANSVLQNGSWYKIATTGNGVYKLSYSFLASLGIDMRTVNPQNLRIYGNGGGMLPELNSTPRIDDLAENAIYVEGESDGIFHQSDFALFYGTGPNTWSANGTACGSFIHTNNLYSDSAYYFITFDLGPGKRIQTQNSSSNPITHTVTTFDDYAANENDNINFIKSGRNWFGEYFDNIASYNFSFSFPNIDMTAPATVTASIASRYISTGNALYSVSCQSGNTTVSIPAITSNPDPVALAYIDYANIENGCFSFTPTSPATTINITKQTSGALGWLDYVEINVRRHLIMTGNQMSFRDLQSKGPGNVADYNFTSAGAVKIWDITDPQNIMLQDVNVSGTNYEFAVPADNLHQFIAFNGVSFNTPIYAGMVKNQDLHSLSDKDMIIVTHPDFYQEALTLAAFHQANDSLTTVVVKTTEIYNEFSSGATDVSAIRDFVKMFYDKAATVNEMPQYLLLFGDGSYDNKRRFTNNSNFIPTYQSFNSTLTTGSYVSDDFFGLLDDNEGFWDDNDNDAVDLGIGRFPVQTKPEANTAVSKILSYNRTGVPPTITNENSCGNTTSSPFGDWRNTICFIADDEDNDLHITQADAIASYVDDSCNNYNIDKIYLDSYQQESTPGGKRYPGANAAINKRIEKGALIINYTGHGGEVGLAHERIVEVSDINKWSNINSLPLFLTATCEFSRFDDPERTSAGEYVFLNPNGGAIALLTTVRLVFAAGNFKLNQDFYRKAFSPTNGVMPRLGDLYYYVKNQSQGNSTNSRNFTLLGDPALRLAYPKYNVSTDSIDFSSVGTVTDSVTLKALSYVTISGFVRAKNGAVLTNYNGVIYPTVFDKPQSVKTLSNDPCPAPVNSSCSPVFSFDIQKNILYKGKVSVTNGYFKYSFVVPKDIAYKMGPGRISYYAENGTDDANGFYERIIIGGSNDSAVADNTGPEIKLYLNDAKFAFGGLTDEQPDLYALLKDDNGINTVGNGIGHDLVAILDANTENSIVLNDFYQADLNSFKSGSVRYPFTDLTEGKHTLDLKVWDVYNNSSKAHTEFVVAKSAQLALSHVLNYPNPFTTKTSFYFEQNQCCQSLEVELQIFTISGKLVKNLSQFIYTEGYRSAPIDWDGRDDFGDKIGKGVYVYRIKVKTSEGQTAEKYEKLVILN